MKRHLLALSHQTRFLNMPSLENLKVEFAIVLKPTPEVTLLLQGGNKLEII